MYLSFELSSGGKNDQRSNIKSNSIESKKLVTSIHMYLCQKV